MNNANTVITATLSNMTNYALTLLDAPGTGDKSNEDTLDDNEGRTANVTITGRTLYKDGNWNTLCLPFSLTPVVLASTPNFDIDHCTLMELDTDGWYDGSGNRHTLKERTIRTRQAPAGTTCRGASSRASRRRRDCISIMVKSE